MITRFNPGQEVFFIHRAVDKSVTIKKGVVIKIVITKDNVTYDIRTTDGVYHEVTANNIAIYKDTLGILL